MGTVKRSFDRRIGDAAQLSRSGRLFHTWARARKLIILDEIDFGVQARTNGHSVAFAALGRRWRRLVSWRLCGDVIQGHHMYRDHHLVPRTPPPVSHLRSFTKSSALHLLGLCRLACWHVGDVGRTGCPPFIGGPSGNGERRSIDVADAECGYILPVYDTWSLLFAQQLIPCNKLCCLLWSTINMRNNRGYDALRGDDDGKIEEGSIEWNKTTEIIPTHTRSFVLYLSISLLSLSLNVLLFLDNARLRNASRDWGKTKYSGITFDTLVPYRSFTEFWNPNISDSASDAAWDAIDTNLMAVSLHDKYAKEVGLGPSTRFPWDTERSIYYVKGFHDLHCLKLVRKAIVSKHNGDNRTFSLHHLFHCLDGLRQDVICSADDTPMPAAVAHHVGDGQMRRCRDWSKLTAWVTRPDQHACHDFDDYREATNTLELFAHCPDNSPYRPVAEAYFAFHGHKDPYEVKDGRHEISF